MAKYMSRPSNRAPTDRNQPCSPNGAQPDLESGWKKDARTPPLKEVRSRVEADLTRERRKQQSEKAIKAIVDTYRVDIDLKSRDGKDLADLDR